jgi:hypothetical protein
MDTGAAVMLGLFAFLAVSAWASSRREQREMELRYELYRRMVEHPGPEADAVRALLTKDAQERQAKGMADKRRGGLVVLAVGIGFGTFLYYIAPDRPVYLLALAPTLVGIVILASGFATARRSRSGGHNATA